jgi:hypothetical protein
VFVFLFLLTSVFSKYYDLMNPCFVYYFSLIQLLYIQEQALRYVNKLYILEKYYGVLVYETLFRGFTFTPFKIIYISIIYCTCKLKILYIDPSNTKYTKQNDKELNTLLNDMKMREGMGQRLTDKLWRVAKI